MRDMHFSSRHDGVLPMSSEKAILIHGLKKSFPVYSKPHHRLFQMIFPAGGKDWFREFHALNGVDFEVVRGETVGIVGRNGSGKSTFLQLVCGTLTPTSGTVEVRGRIAALLELGAGFNPEFTGRENVFLNGAVLGLGRAEMEAKFSEIAEFADIGEFIEQPVKTYSSGMYVRLAFAVAISVTPDILVVDEALSVGDEAFQRKCFSRIEELRRAGCTILFVSHSAGSVIELCDRAVLLDGGDLIMQGMPKDVVAQYQRLLYAPSDKRDGIREAIKAINSSEAKDVRPAHHLHSGSDSQSAEVLAVRRSDLSNAERYDPGFKPESTVEYPSMGATISDPCIVNAAGERVNVLVPGLDYIYRYTVEFSKPASHVHFGMMIKSLTGTYLFGMASHSEGDAIPFVAAGDVFDVQFRFTSRFLPGSYFTNAGCNGVLDDGESRFLHRILDAYLFKVEARETDRRKDGYYDLASEPACVYVLKEGRTDGSGEVRSTTSI